MKTTSTTVIAAALAHLQADINAGRDLRYLIDTVDTDSLSDEVFTHVREDVSKAQPYAIPDNLKSILNVINDAYHHGECQLNESLPDGERGDGLADFVFNEVIEANQGEDDTFLVDRTIEVLNKASRDLNKVVESLINAFSSES